MPETLSLSVPIEHLVESIQQEVSNCDVEVVHPGRLRHFERVELAGLLAQGGMPRLFWKGVETWFNGVLDRRNAAQSLHSRR